MNVEIIAIGDELTTGVRVDTNSAWLSQQFGDMGLAPRFHTTVGDDLQANIEAFQTATSRSDIIVTTGGLGPTADDLTREALAKATQRELVLDEPALDHIEALFSRRGREMPPQNRVQAMFPAGATVVNNPHGSAPGIDLQVELNASNKSRVFCLPGVPAEMKEMWAETVAPAISMMLGGEPRIIRHHRIKCFGVGESDLEKMLPNLIERGRDPLVAITVHEATITLRLSTTGLTDDECVGKITPDIEIIRQHLGELVFGEEDDELEHAVLRMLHERHMKLAVSEQVTEGLLSHWLHRANHPAFAGGTILSPTALASDADSNQVVLNLAKETASQHNADVGLATGWVYEPSDQSPRWTCGLAWGDKKLTQDFPFTAHPAILKPRAAKQALNMLRLGLIEN